MTRILRIRVIHAPRREIAMKTRLLALLAAAALAAAAPGAARAQAGAPGDTLTAFRSGEELARFVRALEAERERRAEEKWRRGQAENQRRQAEAERLHPVSCPPPADSPAPPAGGAVIHGCVRGVPDRPLASAMVEVEGLRLRTVTDAGGRFRLVVPAAALPVARTVTVSVSRLGLTRARRAVELAPGASVSLGFVLAASVFELEQVVRTAPAGTGPRAGRAARDDGGIVRMHGEFLVILRRRRLFTIDVGGGRLRHVSTLDVLPGGAGRDDAWYDDLRVSGDRAMVIGYNERWSSIEIGLFRIGADGRLAHRATWHVRADDYHSPRDQPGRPADGTLVLYAPTRFDKDAADVSATLPALRHWHPAATEDDFRPLIPATRVYRTTRALDPNDELHLHTVLTCDPREAEISCEGKAVLGPPTSGLHLSPSAAYVWVNGWGSAPQPGSNGAMLYRMPLDGGGPRALTVSGTPVDPLSFLEGSDGRLNVVVRFGVGEHPAWQRGTRGSVALLRVPLARFGRGSGAAPPSAYRALPMPEHGDRFRNRFVGRHLLYGAGSGWSDPSPGTAGTVLYAVPFAGGAAARLPLPHGVDHIEAMGVGAVVVGAGGRSLHVTAIGLGARPRVAHRFVRPEASPGEACSRGFAYAPDGPESGILALPGGGPATPGRERVGEGPASVLFLRNDGGRFAALGELAPTAGEAAGGADTVSCTSWYGSARPIFHRGRIFALLGDEIVEGVLRGGRLREIRRTSFATAGRAP